MTLSPRFETECRYDRTERTVCANRKRVSPRRTPEHPLDFRPMIAMGRVGLGNIGVGEVSDE